MAQKNTANKSDALFKKAMETETAPIEFLESYLPEELKEILDIPKVTIEKESYIEEDLKRRLSDFVYSVPFKKCSKDNAYIYCLLEHQSTSRKDIAFRLWKYTLLLLEKHMSKNEKLPIVAPFVIYNGKNKYNAPRSFWELFGDKDMAKSIMGNEYKLIDLHSMSDEEIRKKPHLGLVEFFMKHIHDKELLKIWHESFRNFEELIVCDKRLGLIYIKMLLWYTYDKMSDEDNKQLNKLLVESLNQDGDEIMQTVADRIREELTPTIIEEVTPKLEQKISQAKEIEFVNRMLAKGIPTSEIMELTSLSEEEIRKLEAEKVSN